jgi:Putative prokaryotic signal transducing protein
MKDIRAYATRTEADLDRLALEAAGIHAMVVGVGMPMEGGIQGVRLLVPEELVERALEVLERRQS